LQQLRTEDGKLKISKRANKIGHKRAAAVRTLAAKEIQFSLGNAIKILRID